MKEQVMRARPLAAVAAVAAFGALAAGPDSPKTPVATPEHPVEYAVRTDGAGTARFDKWAFGWLEVDAAKTGDYEIVLAELVEKDGLTPRRIKDSSVFAIAITGRFERTGWVRLPIPDHSDWWKLDSTHIPRLPADLNGTGTAPFKYAQVVRAPFAVTRERIRRQTIRYPFDPGESYFRSSSPALDRVWEFCKYTLLTDTFIGTYVDGERERTPYEADSYITQLSNYAMSSDASVARRTIRYVYGHGTWPTEWRQHFIKMVHADWMYTGTTNLLAEYWAKLPGRGLVRSAERREDGILVTRVRNPRTGRFPQNDIVDWPPCYRAGFDFTNANTVVNAFHGRNLVELSEMAAALGRTEEAAAWSAKAAAFRDDFNRTFFDATRGLYVDGEGSSHASLHANAAALALGLVPGERVRKVADFVAGKGMACGPYFAQYLLEALCAAGREADAIRLMTADGKNSWLGMIAQGADAALETWELESGLPPLEAGWPDMSHAWSTAPLNVIARRIVGVTPRRPGFEEISVAPHLGPLTHIDAKIPTAKGPVEVRIDVRDGSWSVRLRVPAKTVFTAFGQSRTLAPGEHAFEVP